MKNSSTIVFSPASVAPAAAPPVAAPFNSRILIGVIGVFVAAMMSGLNSRLGGLALNDIKAVYGVGADEGSWINSLYAAFELAAMPFATWFAVTLSFRRFHCGVVIVFTLIGALTPFASSFDGLLVLRALQGFAGGLLIPVLMAAALRFFPLPLRLYGLALYAMTATFSPNVATWLSATYTDTLSNWNLVFWQVIPLAVFSVWAVAWGIPQDPVRLERFRQINWLGLICGVSGLALLGLGLTQGERYNWFDDALICAFFSAGIFLIAAFLLTEWFHPLPFIKIQLLQRRNLGLGFTIFVALLVVLLSGSLLPADFLGEVHGFRTPYLAVIGLSVGIPQLILGPMVSFLLYKKWMDARHMFVGGLILLALSCFIATDITTEWMANEFLIVQALQAFGQPMAVISMLFLATSVVQPMEGPVVSGIVNVLRAFGTLLGSAMIGHFLTLREKMHSNFLVDTASRVWRAASNPASLAAGEHSAASLAHRLSHQSVTLAIADAYWVLGVVALVLVPLVLSLHYIKPPVIPSSK